MRIDRFAAVGESQMVKVNALSMRERPAGTPFHIMVKPAGSKCNLACSYCFYLEKEALFGEGQSQRMSPDVLKHYVRRYIEAQPSDPVVFAWQGGEPTLAGLGFFENAVRWQKEYGAGRVIENAFQTNGTRLDDAWGTFLKREDFLVGISIDGPAHLHDAYRVSLSGGGTHASVMRGLDVLKRQRVEFNTLSCVNALNADHGVEVYDYLKNLGARHMQFIPIVERLPDAQARKLGLQLATPPHARRDTGESVPVTAWSVDAKGYGRFLWSVFKRWVRDDVGRIHVQFFEVALGKWLGMGGGLCVFNETCGRALALEHDGGLYACDHYVYPDYKVGDLRTDALADVADGSFQTRFGQAKSDTLPAYCRECTFRFACNGGCPKQRFLTTPDGEPGLNYLCAGYRFVFAKMDPYLQAMAALYRQGRPAADVMELIRRGHLKKPA